MSLLQKLKKREQVERQLALIKISNRYWPLLESAEKRCDHKFGEDYLQRDHIGPTGTSCNLFNTPFVYKKCEICGYVSSRLLDEENNETTFNMKYR